MKSGRIFLPPARAIRHTTFVSLHGSANGFALPELGPEPRFPVQGASPRTTPRVHGWLPRARVRGGLPMTPTPAHCRRIALSLSPAWLLTASGAGLAAAQAIHEPPALPVSIALLPSSDGVEASGFLDTETIDVLLIRNGGTISTITGATSVGGELNVNGGPPSVCWAGVTPDMRPGDIVRFVSNRPNGTVRTIDQARVMPISATSPVVIQNDDPATPGGAGRSE